MSEAPYINFYTSDFLGGTSGMTAATKGVYITLLCLMYEVEGPLTQSWDTLARRCGCTVPAFRKALQSLEDDGKITLSNEGIWSEKCDKHIASRRERRNSAKAAAEKRWQKTQEKQCKADATASNPHCQPEPEPEKSIDANASIGDLGFSEFWEIVPNKVAKQTARKAWRRLSIADRRKAYAAARSGWFEAWQQRHPGASPLHPATFLNQRRWEDQPSTQHTPKGPAHDNRSVTERLAARFAGMDQWEGGDASGALPQRDDPPTECRGSRDDGLDFGPARVHSIADFRSMC